MKREICFLVALLGIGCCKPIVVQAPPPPAVVEPELRVTALKPEATWVEVSEAYKLDLAEWVAYARRMEILLWGKHTAHDANKP